MVLQALWLIIGGGPATAVFNWLPAFVHSTGVPKQLKMLSVLFCWLPFTGPTNPIGRHVHGCCGAYCPAESWANSEKGEACIVNCVDVMLPTQPTQIALCQAMSDKHAYCPAGT